MYVHTRACIFMHIYIYIVYYIRVYTHSYIYKTYTDVCGCVLLRIPFRHAPLFVPSRWARQPLALPDLLATGLGNPKGLSGVG